MKRIPRPSILIDRLHKGIVLACVAVTIYGTGHLGLRWYRYFTVLRPEQKQREIVEQKQLLIEGASSHDIAKELVN